MDKTNTPPSTKHVCLINDCLKIGSICPACGGPLQSRLLKMRVGSIHISGHPREEWGSFVFGWKSDFPPAVSQERSPVLSSSSLSCFLPLPANPASSSPRSALPGAFLRTESTISRKLRSDATEVANQREPVPEMRVLGSRMAKWFYGISALGKKKKN